MRKQLFTWYGLILHMVWGGALLVSPQPMFATPLNYFAKMMWFDQHLTAYTLFFISILCLIGVWLDKRKTHYFTALLCVVPQQFAMIVCALGSIMAIYTSHYADGVVRDASFILADQIPFVIAAIMYTISIINSFGRNLWTHT